ncbi:MAG: FkbM family methyltransferase [Pseudomonadota bacterium]
MSQAVPSSSLLSGDLTTLRHTRHGLMRYFRNDVFIGTALTEYGECDYLLGSALAQLVKPGETALDIGANIGVHTLRLAEAVGPTGRVYTFEPQRLVFQVLCCNLAQNEIPNVWAYFAAVGRTNGTAKIPTPNYAQAGNYGGVSVTEGAGDTVPLMTVDSLKLDAVHLMKIDVEGMEADVLAGAKMTIKRHRPVLYLENDRKEKSPAVIRLLQNADYRLWWHLPPLFNPNNHAGNKTNRFGRILSINILAVPKERRADIRDMTEITSPDDWWKKE